jgi:hypothetical protein
VVSPRHSGRSGILVGGAAGYRKGILLGEIHTDGGVSLTKFVTLGAAGGVALPASSGVRFEALATAGARYYYEWSSGGLLSSDPGLRAWLPHAGGMARMTVAFPSASRGHFELGLLLSWEHDLGTVESEYWYMEREMPFSNDHMEHAHHVVGGDRVLFALTIGTLIGM